MKNQPEIVIMIGLPRSGKTTYVQSVKKDTDFVLSADDLRFEVYNQKYWQEGEPLVWGIREILFRWLLKQGKNIIIDECNMRKSARKSIIDMAKKYGYTIHGRIVSTSSDICIDRVIRGNNDQQLIKVIEKMDSYQELPVMEEGFDYLTTINDN